MGSSDRHAAALRLERMQASPRFSRGKFRNIHPVLPELMRGAVPMPPLREFLFGRSLRRPIAPLPAFDPRDTLLRTPESGLRVTWLGHSTLLIEIDGARFLTDPVWGERLSPVPFVAPKRFQPVPLAIEALPPLDAVLISHDHFDHLDRPSIARLTKLGVPFVTSLGVGKYLSSWGVPEARIIELDWWEEREIAGLSITATPSQHFSGRGVGANATQWASFSVRGPQHSFFFSGDTGLTTEFREIREKLGAFDLVMLEVGAYHPAWGDIHLGPANALTALEWLGGGCFLPVHWGTFDLALHTWDDPAEQLFELAPKRGVQMVMPRLGEAIEPVRMQQLAPKPWWREVAQRELNLPASDQVEQEIEQGTALSAPLD
jgi:L-ascorbate metabolism protein UlaG (beta-lactamase superfamily)